MSGTVQIVESLWRSMHSLNEIHDLAELAKFDDEDILALRQAYAILTRISDKHFNEWKEEAMKTQRDISVSRPLALKTHHPDSP
jgi:cyclopropane fatty-acyl-phospholipid synthase-like methyltransferase